MTSTTQHLSTAGLPLIDAHVHFYDCYDLAEFLGAAVSNFERAAHGLGVSGQSIGVLIFTERTQEQYFRRLRAEADNGTLEIGWRFHTTSEDASIVASRNGVHRLILVAGRQVATAEGLEVLALGADLDLPDGLPLRSATDRVRESGALPVLPWGFGKWWFRRGRLVEDVLRSRPPSEVFLGDNANRPGFGPRPRLFERAASEGYLVLPGTDPLPFPGQQERAGSFGFVLGDRLAWSRPARGIKLIVRERKEQPRVYGQLEGLPTFCRNQVAMQVRKRASQAGRILAARKRVDLGTGSLDGSGVRQEVGRHLRS